MLKALKILIISSVLIIIACSANQMSSRRIIEKLIILDSLKTNQTVDKISYSESEKSFYLLSKKSNLIKIYKNGVFFNQLGGSGFANDNFRKLSDMTIGIDGFLYTLDSFEKSVKRFDKDGKYHNQISLSSLASPEKFAFTGSGTLYVFDSHSKEIFVLDAFDFSIKLSFGKFQVTNADLFFITGNYLNIYDKSTDETSIFNLSGMFENSFKGLSFYDTNRNLLTVKNNSLTDSRTDKQLYKSLHPVSLFNLHRNNFIIYDNHNIKVLRAIYETQ